MEKGRNGKIPLFIIIIIIVLASVGFLLRNKIGGMLTNKPQASPIVEGSASPFFEPSPSPSSTPFLRSELTLEILNGAGKSGLAKTLAEELETLGYKVVKVGNAERSDWEKTEIQLGPEAADMLETLIADLRDTIKISSVGGELKDSSASARIIIGKDSI